MPSHRSDEDRITVVVDTREQEPYVFDPRCVAVTRRALPAGDYSIEGREDSVAVERKTLEDFVSTVIRSRKRFTRELQRLAGYEAACIVVEADLSDILGGRYRSRAHPNAVLGTVLSIVVDFDIPVFFCSDRQAACRFVEGFLLRFHRKELRRWEEEQKATP
ncbi:MAG: ERCC4 domain-containing protein [Candidatus Hydrogenedentes bacterium]|nr:ERCC4 domain-containing protein [Candidatus Hydrogenedentota bacterium]